MHKCQLLKTKSQEPYLEKEISIENGDRYLFIHRVNACWDDISYGRDISSMPNETMFIIVDREGKYFIYFALCDGSARSSFFSKNGVPYLRAETNDPSTILGEFNYCVVLETADIYSGISRIYKFLNENGYNLLSKRERGEPEFIDYFGFCTYNAFYDNINHDLLVSVVKKYAENGATLGFIIIDAGWQDVNGHYLKSFDADKIKFPKGIKGFATEIKDLGVKKVLCWQTYNGFWQGLDKDSFKEYKIKNEPFHIPSHIQLKKDSDNFNATVGGDFFPQNICYSDTGNLYDDYSKYYDDYFSFLKDNNVDGAKVDAISWQEAFCYDKGGRVKNMNNLLQGITEKGKEYLNGNVILCSGCTNELFFSDQKGVVIRSSEDYIPDALGTYLRHIRINAFLSVFINDILVPDWDMFQTSSLCGEYHAIARTISGGPIYVTDEPEKCDYGIVKRMCGEDGRVYRCLESARPVENCIFGEKVDEAFRVFNYTKHGYVLGFFGKGGITNTKYSLSEIYNIPEGVYAIYSYRYGFIGVKNIYKVLTETLPPFGSDVITAIKVVNDCAVFGRVDKYNPSAFIDDIREEDKGLSYSLKEYGDCGIYTKKGGFFVVKSEGGKVDRKTKG